MDFKSLKDLAKTITKNKVKQIEVLGNPDNESRAQELYDGIVSGRFNSYEDAALHFFGISDIQDSRFRKLKNKLIRQLINTGLFIDVNQPMFNERAKAYYNCYRDFAAAHILSLRDAGLASIFLFEQTIEQAMKFEFVDLVVDISRELRRLYASVYGDPAKHEKISQIYRQYEEKKALERLAVEKYETLINYYLVKRSPNEEVNKIAKSFYEELLPKAEGVNTSMFILQWFVKNFRVVGIYTW